MMKNLPKSLPVLFLCTLFLSSLYAQSPDKMSYQAVIRNNSNALVVNTRVGMQISVLQGSASGSPVYIETHAPATNANGLVSIEIGDGTVVSGNFAAIDWADGPYFIKTETDPAGGTNYSITGTSQLLSVPFALHAKTAEALTKEIAETDPVFSAWDKSYNDLTNKPDLSIYASAAEFEAGLDTKVDKETGKGLSTHDYTTAEQSKLAGIEAGAQVNVIADWNATSGDSQIMNKPNLATVAGSGDFNDLVNKPLNVSDFINDVGYLSSFTESQILTISNDTIYLTGGSFVKLPAGFDGHYSSLTGLPETFTPASHEHSAADVTSGTLAFARIPTGTAASTVATGNHTHGNITSDGRIGTAAGRIVTTGANGALTATAGNAVGQMLYWNGTAWINIPPGSTGQVLTFFNGAPTWGASGMGMGVNDVYNPKTGRIWMDRNLGATRVATSSTDASSYGWLYQWGRGTDGHQLRTSTNTGTLSNSDTPGHGDFILTPNQPHSWRSPINTNLWQGVNGTNNPCPTGYRLPTEAEWETERLSWISNNPAGAYASPLKLPMAGCRAGFEPGGPIDNVGTWGWYWTSTSTGFARVFYFNSSEAQVGNTGQGWGSSVRCIKN